MHGSEFLTEVTEHTDVNLNGYCGDAIIGGGFLSRKSWNKRATVANTKSFYGRYAELADIESDFYNINYVLSSNYT